MNRFRRSGRSVAAVLWRKRFLLREMALLDMRDRYAGRAFGLFWAIIVPLFSIEGMLLFFEDLKNRIFVQTMLGDGKKFPWNPVIKNIVC